MPKHTKKKRAVSSALAARRRTQAAVRKPVRRK